MLIAVVVTLALAPPTPTERPFALAAPAEVVATVRARCRACDWAVRGREAAALELRVDGCYSQHLLLTRGPALADYRVGLGRLARGAHRLRVAVDARRSARGARDAEIASLEIESFDPATPEGRQLAHAPILMARPDSVGRFTDVPLIVWVETDASPGGRVRLRYSVVFSNEDGGTPADRLMATWGRLTDIEFVYGVELGASDQVVTDEYQGPKHRVRPFLGRYEGAHPVLYVVTDNNMASDHGRQTIRFVPAVVSFDLTGTSREAVMDAFPWSYAVSAREARREGRIDEQAALGSNKIPDPRRYLTLEACADAEDATIAFSAVVRGVGGVARDFWSDGGLPKYRIGRRRATELHNGCFRGAVALPSSTTADQIVALRFRAFTRIAGEGEPAPGSGAASLRRVNALFFLGADDLPGPSLFSWRGDRPLAPEVAPVELPVVH
jgi:hypothetical protein